MYPCSVGKKSLGMYVNSRKLTGFGDSVEAALVSALVILIIGQPVVV